MRVHSVWVGPLQLVLVHHMQCEGFPAVTKDSRRRSVGSRASQEHAHVLAWNGRPKLR